MSRVNNIKCNSPYYINQVLETLTYRYIGTSSSFGHSRMNIQSEYRTVPHYHPTHNIWQLKREG